MHRILATIGVWIVCMMAIRGFHEPEGGRIPPPEPLLQMEARFPPLDLEIQTSFEGRPDPFAIDTASASALQVEYDGKRVADFEAFSGHDLPLRLTLPGTAGPSELRVTATPPVGHATPTALRVRIREGSTLLADRTTWSEGGEMSITLIPTPSATSGTTEDDHGH